MKKLRYIIIGIVFLSCKKEKVNNLTVFEKITINKTQFDADGQSTATVSVNLNNETPSERRNVLFTTDNGVFKASGSNKHTVKAEFLHGDLIASAIIIAPIEPKLVTIKVQPEYDSPIQEFTTTITINAIESKPSSLNLEPSALGLASNSLNEVKLTGELLNSESKWVSTGYKVGFTDQLMDGTAAGGQFRMVQNTTADSSKVRAIYGASTHSIGTKIKISAAVLDQNGQPTGISDAVILTINL